jgi:hypothetical protein
VAVCLGVISERAFGDRVVFLWKQASWANRVHELAEQLFRVGVPSGEQIGLDHPGSAQVEPALRTRKPVVAPVTVDGAAGT